MGSLRVFPDSSATTAGSPPTIVSRVRSATSQRQSVRLELRRGTMLCGRIEIASGEVWNASDVYGFGVEAFRRLLTANDATVVSRVLSAPPRTRNIERPTVEILREISGERSRVTTSPAPPVHAEKRETVRIDQEDIATLRSRIAALKEASAGGEERVFDACIERAVDAVLAKNHAAAYEAFLEASRIRPDDARVVSNLIRLRQMGFGKDGRDKGERGGE